MAHSPGLPWPLLAQALNATNSDSLGAHDHDLMVGCPIMSEFRPMPSMAHTKTRGGGWMTQSHVSTCPSGP